MLIFHNGNFIPTENDSPLSIHPVSFSSLFLWVCYFNLLKTLHAAYTFFPGPFTPLLQHTSHRILTAWPRAAVCISVFLSLSFSHDLDSRIHPFLIQAPLSMTALPSGSNIENFSAPKHSPSQFEHQHIEGAILVSVSDLPQHSFPSVHCCSSHTAATLKGIIRPELRP